jgi:hypothetical protein
MMTLAVMTLGGLITCRRGRGGGGGGGCRGEEGRAEGREDDDAGSDDIGRFHHRKENSGKG